MFATGEDVQLGLLRRRSTEEERPTVGKRERGLNLLFIKIASHSITKAFQCRGGHLGWEELKSVELGQEAKVMISQQFEWQYKIYIITTVEQKGKLFKKKPLS